MSEVKKPRTMREQIDQMWYVLVGLNGGGLMSRVEALDNKFADYVANRANTCPLNLYGREEERNAAIERDQRRTTVQLISVLVAALAVASAILIAILKP